MIDLLTGSLWPYLAALGGAVAVLWRLWRGAEAKRRAAERRAKTHQEMREIERDAQQMDDTSLADRITRRR